MTVHIEEVVEHALEAVELFGNVGCKTTVANLVECVVHCCLPITKCVDVILETLHDLRQFRWLWS